MITTHWKHKKIKLLFLIVFYCA